MVMTHFYVLSLCFWTATDKAKLAKNKPLYSGTFSVKSPISAIKKYSSTSPLPKVTEAFIKEDPEKIIAPSTSITLSN
jgi:hypothetical protein